MTLEEALKRKEVIGKTVTKNGMEYNVTIVPEREKDFEDFIDSYLGSSDKIELAKASSVNQQFKLCGIWSNGSSIMKTKVQ